MHYDDHAPFCVTLKERALDSMRNSASVVDFAAVFASRGGGILGPCIICPIACQYSVDWYSRGSPRHYRIDFVKMEQKDFAKDFPHPIRAIQIFIDGSEPAVQPHAFTFIRERRCV